VTQLRLFGTKYTSKTCDEKITPLPSPRKPIFMQHEGVLPTLFLEPLLYHTDTGNSFMWYLYRQRISSVHLQAFLKRFVLSGNLFLYQYS
jgi:hypothetical protein